VNTIPSVEFTVYPDDCDAFGHVNQASFVALLERARWNALATGPGMDAFTRHEAWPAIRKTTIEFYRQVFPGDGIRFSIEFQREGQTSFFVRQIARKVGDEGTVAEAEFLFTCIGKDGRPVPVPPEVGQFFGARPSRRTGVTRHMRVRELLTAVEVNGDGDAILLAHGFPLDRTMWHRFSGILTGWLRVFPDLRGLGLNQMPDSGYSMAEYADDLVALLDTLHIEKAVFCGLSMGGYIGFEMLRRHADRVRALILMNTKAIADDPEARAVRDRTITRVRRDGSGFLADEMIPKLLASTSLQAQPDVERMVRNMIEQSPAEGVVGALTAMRDRPDSTPMLPEIAVPTLVVHGSDDNLIPIEEARAMADGIPGAHFAVIPAAGHLSPLEQPVNTGRVVREFLESLH
jgi:pimeloyl-ACP methyl ester carboxylesterase